MRIFRIGLNRMGLSFNANIFFIKISSLDSYHLVIDVKMCVMNDENL